MLKAILIEDEIDVRNSFVKLLNMFCPKVELIEIFDNVSDGVTGVNRLSFDILFLDVNLPDGNGFDLIDQLDNRDFALIFVTAYDQYALDAFRISALDYLLKPVSPDLLKKAVRKVELKQINPIDSIQIDIIKEIQLGQFNQSQKILLRGIDNVNLIALSQLVYCVAEGSYTSFHVLNMKKIVVSLNLKEYEIILEPYGFVRTHHSYLVNAHHIKNINKSDGGSLVLSNDIVIPISTRKKVRVLEKINELFLG